jgi:hypothetical protein
MHSPGRAQLGDCQCLSLSSLLCFFSSFLLPDQGFSVSAMMTPGSVPRQRTSARALPALLCARLSAACLEPYSEHVLLPPQTGRQPPWEIYSMHTTTRQVRHVPAPPSRSLSKSHNRSLINGHGMVGLRRLGVGHSHGGLMGRILRLAVLGRALRVPLVAPLLLVLLGVAPAVALRVRLRVALRIALPEGEAS